MSLSSYEKEEDAKMTLDEAWRQLETLNSQLIDVSNDRPRSMVFRRVAGQTRCNSSGWGPPTKPNWWSSSGAKPEFRAEESYFWTDFQKNTDCPSPFREAELAHYGTALDSFGTTCKVRHCQQKKRGTRVLSALAERVVYAESPIRGSVGVEGRGSAPPEERRSVKIRDPPSLRMARIPISRAGS